MTKPLNWAPVELLGLNQPLDDQSFNAFVGQALAIEIDGIPTIVLAKSVGDLATIMPTLKAKSLDTSLIYGAALVSAKAVQTADGSTPPPVADAAVVEAIATAPVALDEDEEL